MELYTAEDLRVYEVVDLGQAVGTAYGPASLLLTGRDGLHVSRMTKRALILGIAYTGASVLDLRLTPRLVLQAHLKKQGVGALYVDYRPGSIRVWLEGEGAEEKAEEVTKLRKSKAFTRAPLSDLGAISLYPNAVDDFVSDLHKRVDYLRSIQVLVDCQNLPLTVLIPALLGSYGMKVDTFNDRVTDYQEPQGEEDFFARFQGSDYHLALRCLEGRFELHTRGGDHSAFRDLPSVLQAMESA